MNLLIDKRVDTFNLENSRKRNGHNQKEKIINLLRYQLEKVEKIIDDHKIEVYSPSIIGDDLEEENMIKIEFVEDTSEKIVGKGKNKKRLKRRGIISRIIYTRKIVSEFV
ncbi:hypothetical protein [Brevibacillus migulae]|uniref:hypothetical protein n=1 Tax=Brevibacillus migulae TaxID=1644114 RepID=UPI00106E721F|nr:hypothetical protein [Brevibacillus migulae]